MLMGLYSWLKTKVNIALKRLFILTTLRGITINNIYKQGGILVIKAFLRIALFDFIIILISILYIVIDLKTTKFPVTTNYYLISLYILILLSLIMVFINLFQYFDKKKQWKLKINYLNFDNNGFHFDKEYQVVKNFSEMNLFDVTLGIKKKN
ncbi:hypothetical protein [Mycoplasmopsis mustelae]|nr:hypothetical protein [Mycoplasmopsis mustelae]